MIPSSDRLAHLPELPQYCANPARGKVFISYSRHNREIVKALYEKLDRLGFPLWQDVHDIPAGDDWWRVIKQAIDGSETMILCMSVEALQSPVISDEWNYARQQGKRVIPVIVGEVFEHPLVKSGEVRIANWMRRANWADIRQENPDALVAWARLIETLNSAPTPHRVVFMVPEPEDFIPRPAEMNDVIDHLVDERADAVARTTSLVGAGGYGKTALAQAIASDIRVSGAFDDGILWVELGERPDNLLGKLLDLVYELTGERPPVTDLATAHTEFEKAIGERYVLLVIDDMWDYAHLKPFLVKRNHIATLITTRRPALLPKDAFTREVDTMTLQQATALLSWRIPEDQVTANEEALYGLAKDLGCWPQMLRTANGVLRTRLKLGDNLLGAVAYMNDGLAAEGFDAFKNEQSQSERYRTASAVFEVSVQLLEDSEKSKFNQLAIFSEDEDIPLSTLERYWKLNSYRTEKLAETLYQGAGLLRKFNLGLRAVRLHDTVRTYLRKKNEGQLAVWNAELIASWGDLYNLPDDYAWQHVAYHLNEAGRAKTLQSLLIDFNWLRAKLNATNVNTLLADYGVAPQGSTLSLVQKAIVLSGHILSRDKTQLWNQLFGRLGKLSRSHPELVPLLEAAPSDLKLQLKSSSLQAPAGRLLRVLSEHTGFVTGALQLADNRLLSWSTDGTLRLWSAEGQSEAVLTGHRDTVRSVLELTSRRLLSRSDDQTLRLWSIHGEPEMILDGHTNSVNGVVELADGRLLSWSNDQTLRLWSAEGEPGAILKGHTDAVNGVVELTDGRLLSWSRDQTLRLWSIEGEPEAILKGHTDAVNGAVELADGRLLSWSSDQTLQLWSAEGEPGAILKGHTDAVTSAVELADGRLLSGAVGIASSDNSLRLWCSDGAPQEVMEGNKEWVQGVIELSDGRLLSWGGDSMLRLWSAAGEPEAVLEGHMGAISGALELSDHRLLSWTDNGKLRLWSAAGEPEAVLEGHTSWVWGALELTNGQLLSWALDYTLRLWSAEGQAEPIEERYTFPVLTSLELSDGRLLILHRYDGALKLWSAEGEPGAILKGHTDAVNGVVELTDGRLLSWSSDQTLRLWSAEGEPGAILKGHTDAVNGAVELADGRLLSWSSDQTLCLWNVSGRLEDVLEGHKASVIGVLQMTNGQLLSWAGNTLRLWNAAGRLEAVLEGHTGSVNGARELADGRLLSWSCDKTLRLWSATGQPEAVMEGHTGWELNAVQLANGWIVSWASDSLAHRDYTLRLWNAAGRLEAVLEGHTGSVNGARELADGRLLSWSRDKTLRLWSATGQSEAVMEGHTGSVNGALELADGQLFSWETEGAPRLWSSRGKALAAFWCDHPIAGCALVRSTNTIVVIDGLGLVHFLKVN